MKYNRRNRDHRRAHWGNRIAKEVINEMYLKDAYELTAKLRKRITPESWNPLVMDWLADIANSYTRANDGRLRSIIRRYHEFVIMPDIVFATLFVHRNDISFQHWLAIRKRVNRFLKLLPKGFHETYPEITAKTEAAVRLGAGSNRPY